MAYVLGNPFPRIPLFLQLPDSMPGIKSITGFTVSPVLEDIKITGRDVEIIGSFTVNVSYIGESNNALNEKQVHSPDCGCFFQGLRIKEGCLLEDSYDEAGNLSVETAVYSWSWGDKIHTYIEMKKKLPSSHSLMLKVEQCDITARTHREAEGHLILKLESSKIH